MLQTFLLLLSLLTQIGFCETEAQTKTQSLNERMSEVYVDEALSKLRTLTSASAQRACLNTVHRPHKISLVPQEMDIDGQGEKRRVLVYKIQEPFPEFSTTDEAARFIVSFSRARFKNSEYVEYCSSFVRDNKTGMYKVQYINQGTPSSCRVLPLDKGPDEPLWTVHTHPGSSKDLSGPSQTPSASDYAAAAFNNTLSYMGAPAGQILRYGKEDVECRGNFIRYKFTEIQKPAEAQGEYEMSQSFRPMNGDDLKYRKLLCGE